MNAYELADALLKNLTMEYDCDKYMEQAANMLRQQADRIAELEGEVSTLKHMNKNWSISEGWALQRVAELEKAQRFIQNFAEEQHHRACALEEAQTNAEPVAWIMKANDPDLDKDWYCFGRKPTRQEKVSRRAIPLYTTPQIGRAHV